MSSAVLGHTLGPFQFPWVIYALGQDKGALDRSVAIANLAAVERQVFLLTNSDYAAVIQSQATHDNLCVQPVSPDATEEAVVAQVTQLLSVAPFVLIVDALPTGFYGELANVLQELSNIPKILVLRDFKPDYIISQNLRYLIENYYDLAIIPGLAEGTALADLPNVIQTGPWVSPAILGLSGGQNVLALQEATLAEDTHATLLVLASDVADELEVYGYLANTIAQQCPWVSVRCLSSVPPSNCAVELWDSHWPAIDYLPAADLVIGGGDYSTVYLCQALKIPLIAFPWARSGDFQRERLEKMVALDEDTFKIVTSAEEALCQTFDFLNQGMEKDLFSPQKRSQRFGLGGSTESGLNNSVQVCMRLIEEVLENKWNQVAYAAMAQDVNQLRLSRRVS